MIEKIRREVLLTVSVPKEFFWLFLEAFGKAFELRGTDDLGRAWRSPHPVEGYEIDPRTPERMQVSIFFSPEQEEAFADFCLGFERGVSLREALQGWTPSR